MKTLVVTDHEFMYQQLLEILKKKNLNLAQFDFRYSHHNRAFAQKYGIGGDFRPIDVKEEADQIVAQYDLAISLHCKQKFPAKLVNSIPCINVHPGYNPFNRGWYPQAFSIINKLPVGVTIHKMDEQLDHGDIIYRKQVEIESWETSAEVYHKILQLEVQMLDECIENLLLGNYPLQPPEMEGNYNRIEDYKKLCQIDLNEKVTFREAIDRLRALTHGDYRNAYFIDEKGNKVWIKIALEKADS